MTIYDTTSNVWKNLTYSGKSTPHELVDVVYASRSSAEPVMYNASKQKQISRAIVERTCATNALCCMLSTHLSRVWIPGATATVGNVECAVQFAEVG